MTRGELEDVLERALERLDPAARVAAELPRAIRRGDRPVSVVAIGKAAPAMAAGVLASRAEAIRDVLVVTSDGTDVSNLEADGRVEVLRSGHPLPDRRSVVAANRCLQRARAVAHQAGLLLVLVSGGASALVCAPAAGIRLRDKQDVTRAMLASGASIQEINVVRRHLSRIKGGGLARAAHPASVVTLVLSDVIGGTVADVGSGPSVGDRSSVARARRLLLRYAARFGELPLVATGPAPNVRSARIVASPEELARVVASELRTRGIRARVLAPSQRSVNELASEYVARARRLRPGTAIVRAAEPSLEVPAGAGQGGRSTHLAALVGLDLPRGAMFLAAATDGVDGASRTGGAIVDRSLVVALGERAIRRALDRYDTGKLHVSAATALPLRPSGQNLADVHILVASK